MFQCLPLEAYSDGLVVYRQTAVGNFYAPVVPSLLRFLFAEDVFRGFP